MRDAERLRDRRQFSFDDRQLLALALSALLLVSGVFSLGLLIGRRSAARAPEAGSGASQLAALDAQARRPQAAPAPGPAKPPPPAAPLAAPSEVPPPVRSATVIPPPPPPAAVATPPASAPPALAPPPRELGAFTVQVGASQDRGEAARLQGRVRTAGLKPYVVEARLLGKGTWYRVRVGAFPDRESATRFRKDVERELRLAAVVMPAR
ncbi:MAG TPA: SPOR domain-containing protein [Myxococcales bacterium]|nr:SPOR domain-containing protein [Myxococcales bacterium]